MKKNVTILLAICVVLFVVGMFVLLNSVNIGMSFASKAIQQNGGSMDTAQYNFIMQYNMLVYLICGGICSLIGGLGALIFGYKQISLK